MSKNPAAIGVRLSAAQMSVIWPGIDFIVSAYLAKIAGNDLIHAYPFRIPIAPPSFDRGTFDSALIDQLVDLRKPLKTKTKVGTPFKGGRLQMDGGNVPRIQSADLTKEWTTRLEITREIGTLWLQKNRTALLEVPSATIPATYNFLFNHIHPSAAGFRITDAFSFPFDVRLKK